MDKREGYVELFRAEYPGVVRELSLVLGDRALAEDVAAEAFVDLWGRWEQVSGFDRPGAWVRRVSLRKASRARWRRRRRQVVEGLGVPEQTPVESNLDLVRALAELTETQRVAVVMHHLGGWPTAEIASMLGCADVTVRSHLSLGRQRLAELLGESDEVDEVDEVDDA